MRLLIKTLFGAAALVLTAGPVQATSFFNVDGQLNGPDPVMTPGNAPLNTGITVHAGDQVTLSINPSDTWGFNGYQVNALGTYAFGWAPWNTYAIDTANVPGAYNLAGYGSANGYQCYNMSCIQYGAVAWSLDGLGWGAGYTDTGTTGTVSTPYGGVISNYPIWTVGTTFTAPSTGVLRLAMWDSVTSDNSSGVGSDRIIQVGVDVVPAVPEPASMALLGVALAGFGLARRSRG